MASFPPTKRNLWNFVDTGRTMCDASVSDLVRSMATRASWSGISDIINELKSTSWMRNVTQRYLHLCDELGVQPEHVPAELPSAYRLSKEWIRELFMSNSQQRPEAQHCCLHAQAGKDILAIDWTKDAAKRCGANFLLKVMDGTGQILLWHLTETSSPYEAEPLLLDLKERRVNPRVVYVDDGCCTTWKQILESIWPGVCVRLDCLHAIMRLTQTTTSTRHPWHGRFCSMLSKAFYTHDD